MKILTKTVAIVLIAGIMLALAGCSGSKGGEQFTVGIIQYVDHVALDAAREGFIAALADNGYKDGDKIVLDYHNAQAVAGKTKDIPILGTAITDYVAARLADSNEKPGGNVSGTTDMNPIKEQIDLLVKLVPGAKTVGVLYTSSEDNSVVQAGLARQAIEALGLTYTEVTVSNSNEVQQATQAIVEKCDAIYIPTDNIFASAMPVVHGVTSQSKTPVICGEAGMVENGGLATLGINYYNLGYQTGLMALRILEDGAKPADMPIESSTEYEFAINGDVAAEIGLEIPADLQEYVISSK
ncbi:MAG TPA: ABC transporter substrate-binding protein [Firmicutes bacterium]|nr:ABC transporter substrate-binding protein [Bacillota bacterium]